MKKAPRSKKYFKELIISMTVADLLLVSVLYGLRGTIISGEVAYGHTISQVYFLYIVLVLAIVSMTFIPYLGYRDYVKKGLVLPRLWKKVYVIFFPIISLVFAFLISFYIK